MPEEHEFLTADEDAALRRVSTKTVRSLVREGTLSGDKVGRAWRFLRSDVLELVRGGSADKVGPESGGITELGGGLDD